MLLAMPYFSSDNREKSKSSGMSTGRLYFMLYHLLGVCVYIYVYVYVYTCVGLFLFLLQVSVCDIRIDAEKLSYSLIVMVKVY